MAITFTGTTNKDYIMINTITFRTPDGTILRVDREWTEYGIHNGKLNMCWINCYLWDDNHDDPSNPAYLTDDDYSRLRNAEIIDIELEDDADKDYVVNITNFSV